ncbi:GDP-mannose 4,6-dehydratase [Paludisphaera mucosa]|uniref:GDP-mannose 4,6-dehydratase n=1 Tax=Paludisphaera mucosa TaxID=3030827 RepID=A0ABT6FJC3_9BACT|nr:GDP-mannose 4,6-dehydratase [Paludisphaera mucosa]
MRAFVTGISGFVGGHLAEHLLASGDQVAGVSASGRFPDDLAELARSVRIERLDLMDVDQAELADLLRRKQPEAIYHLAAQSNPRASFDDPRGTWALNLGGTLNLLSAVKEAGLAPKPRVVIVGSGVCYGDPPPEFIPVTESCPLRPNNPYSASKAAADLLGVQMHLSDGLDVVMARPFNHAGPRQSPRYVLATLAHQVAEVEAGLKDAVEVGNLDVVRDYTDVRDVVRAYRLLAQGGKAGEIYNLGTGRGLKLTDALDRFLALATKPIAVRIDPARVRAVDLPYLVADPSKLRAAVGWEPVFPIDQTLADMLADARRRVAGG